MLSSSDFITTPPPHYLADLFTVSIVTRVLLWLDFTEPFILAKNSSRCSKGIRIEDNAIMITRILDKEAGNVLGLNAQC